MALLIRALVAVGLVTYEPASGVRLDVSAWARRQPWGGIVS
jgi:hypothetical protein